MRSRGVTTTLRYAAAAGDVAAVRLCLAAGSGVAVDEVGVGSDRWTALMLAAKGGHSDVVDALLAAGASVHVTDASGRTPCMLAAMRSAECVRALVRHGSDVNAADKDGWTALWYAVASWRAECVEALLECSELDLDRRDSNGDSASDMSRRMIGIPSRAIAERIDILVRA